MSGVLLPVAPCFGASLSSCAVWWIIREDVGGWSPCCLGLVGHLQQSDVDRTLAMSLDSNRFSLLDGATAMNTGQGVCIAFCRFAPL
ncbi:hypothetical protein PF003_g41048 [Phytophthora fragariae]|nr:hypothetical protein PF003_g41048 [Phytophthora fragariae]